MKFANSTWLYVLLLLPFMLLLWRLWNQQADERLRSFTGGGAKPVKRVPRMALTITGFAMLLLAIARPQYGELPVQVKSVGVDIIVAMDASLSMLAEDVQPSRSKRAKKIAADLADKFEGNRLGLILFAGSASVECPLTLDANTFRLFLSGVNPGMVPVGGTDISGAINMAMPAFGEAKGGSKVLVIISDGDDSLGKSGEAAKRAADAGITIYSIGLGTKNGAPIPLRRADGSMAGYKKDKNGNMVITKQEGDTLRKVADETGGLFITSNGGGVDVQPIVDAVEQLEKGGIGTNGIKQLQERFQIPLALSLLLFALAWRL